MRADTPNEIVDSLAQVIWDYMLMHQPIQRADGILALGSRDTRTAEQAAHLFLEGWAPFILFSGDTGVTEHTRTEWGMSEAEKFAEVALGMGVPEEFVLLETASRNTGDNIQFSRCLLEEKGIAVESLIVVQKPYMERRTYATFMKQWPGMDFIVSSAPIAYEDYATERISKEETINAMVGDLQRIREYPAKGFQIEQEIPSEVWAAREELVRLGFNTRPVL